MYKNQKRVVASFALVAGIASSVSAVNAFANKMVKAMAYRHHKEDDKPSILETKYASKNMFHKFHHYPTRVNEFSKNVP